MSRDWTQEEFEITKDTKVLDIKKENQLLRKNLDIAIKALEKYAKRKNWQDIELYDIVYFEAQFKCCGYEIAEKALTKIKENK